MRLLLCLFVLVSLPVHGAFKITVLSSDKPTINKIEVPADKPSIKVSSVMQAAKQQPVVNKVELNPDPYSRQQVAGDLKAAAKPVALSEPVFIADAPKDSDLAVSGLNKYEQLQTIKKAQGQHAQAGGGGAVEAIVDETQMVKPLLSMNKGETVADVLEGWAKNERHQVVFDLGVWKRIKDLKMSVDYLFTSELKESVKKYLELLNGTANLKSNDVTLHACFYSDRFFKITTDDSKCEV